MTQTLLAILASFVLFTGCTKDSDHTTSSQKTKKTVSAGKEIKELKVGITQEFENLNTVISQMLATSYLYKVAGRNLVTLDVDGNWIPQVVEKFPTLENKLARLEEYEGKETIVADWRIRDDQFWGDGTPVTAKDVEFAVKVGSHPNISVGEKEVYQQIKKVILDPKDPKKFTFIYDKPRWDFNHLGTFFILPRHLEEPVFKEHSAQPLGYEKNTLYVTQPTNPGLYNGPYIVKEIKLGSHVVFVPNPQWKGKKPAIPQLTFKLIPNTATLEANLRSNTIDMISVLGLTFDQAVKFNQTVAKESLPYNVNFVPSLVYEHVDVQMGKNEFLKDVRVRKALVYGINRDDLVNALFDGKQKKAIHNIATIDPWYTDDPDKIVLYSYSPRKAKKLLDEAGWTLKEDGYRYKDNKKLSLQFMTTSGNKARELVQTYLQDQWKQIGVEIIIKNEPARVYFGETIRKAKYPALAMYAWISSPENNPKSTFMTKNIPTEKNGFSGQNSMGWSNKEVDELLTALDSEFSHEKRVEMMAKVLYHYTNDVPVIPLYYRANISVTPQWLSGYRLSPHQFSSTNHVENWTAN